MLKEDEPLLKRGTSSKPLNPQDSGRPPVKICTLSQFEPKLEEISHQLQPIFLNRDLMEPFDRLEKACADVDSRNVGNN